MSTDHYVLVNTKTGVIEALNSVPLGIRPIRIKGFTHVKVSDDLGRANDVQETHYGRKRGLRWEVCERPVMPARLTKLEIAADGKDASIVTRIPVRATVTIDGETVETEDRLTLTSDMPGTYTVTVECWPFIPRTWEIIAR